MYIHRQFSLILSIFGTDQFLTAFCSFFNFIHDRRIQRALFKRYRELHRTEPVRKTQPEKSSGMEVRGVDKESTRAWWLEKKRRRKEKGKNWDGDWLQLYSIFYLGDGFSSQIALLYDCYTPHPIQSVDELRCYEKRKTLLVYTI